MCVCIYIYIYIYIYMLCYSASSYNLLCSILRICYYLKNRNCEQTIMQLIYNVYQQVKTYSMTIFTKNCFISVYL